jgi:hypothetical protein
MMMGRSGRAVVLLASLAVASCAAPVPPPPVAPVVSARGVIVAIRPLDAPADATVRASILAAVGAGAGAGAGGAPGPLVAEFIIREDHGRTISVMQVNDGQFAPHQRVALIGDVHPRISALGS